MNVTETAKASIMTFKQRPQCVKLRTVQEAVAESGRMLAQLVLIVQQMDLMYPSPTW